jgi:hypothetical protein
VTTEALPLQNAPPRLFISPVPALLVHVGGAPVYRPEPGTPLQRVLNTRVLLLKDASDRHYLRVGVCHSRPGVPAPGVYPLRGLRPGARDAAAEHAVSCAQPCSSACLLQRAGQLWHYSKRQSRNPVGERICLPARIDYPQMFQ